MSLATRRVNRGAKLLDRNIPGWWDVVDPVTLDLVTYDHCVLGQIAGRLYPRQEEYQRWVQLTENDLGLGLIGSFAHGFDAIRTRKTRILERHWRTAVAVRKQAAIVVTRNIEQTIPEREEIYA